MSHSADFVCDSAGEQLLIRVRGEIDHHSAAAIRNGIDSALFEKRPRRLILDMSAVTFMDSSGLGLIMGRLSVVRELGGELTVKDPSEAIGRIIRLAGMEDVINIEHSREQDCPKPLATPRKRRRGVLPRTERRVAK
jgi:stage II sporulation protein AA (anti-sigma F factor antagonist)